MVRPSTPSSQHAMANEPLRSTLHTARAVEMVTLPTGRRGRAALVVRPGERDDEALALALAFGRNVLAALPRGATRCGRLAERAQEMARCGCTSGRCEERSSDVRRPPFVRSRQREQLRRQRALLDGARTALRDLREHLVARRALREAERRSITAANVAVPAVAHHHGERRGQPRDADARGVGHLLVLTEAAGPRRADAG